MPTVDAMPGIGSTGLGAAEIVANLNRQKTDRALGGLQGIANAATGSIHDKMLGDVLEANGLDRRLVADPHAAGQAILDKYHADQQAKSQGAQFGHEDASQSARFGHEDTAAKSAQEAAMALHTAPTGDFTAGQAKSDADDQAVGAAASQLAAPVPVPHQFSASDMLPGVAPLPDGSRPGEPEDVNERAAALPPDQQSDAAVQSAMKRVQFGKGRPAPPTKALDQPITDEEEAKSLGVPVGTMRRTAFKLFSEAQSTGRTNTTVGGADTREGKREAFQGGEGDKNRALQQQRITDARTKVQADLANVPLAERLKTIRGMLAAESRAPLGLDPDREKALNEEAEKIEAQFSKGAQGGAGATAADGTPTADEMAKINSSPGYAKAWASFTPEQKAEALKAMRGK